MSTAPPVPEKPAGLLNRYPVVAYFLLTYAISWSGALLLVAPKLIRGWSQCGVHRTDLAR
jgi:hypothetical protein